jgi:Caenorhabditis protein of unknown function, DUF268
MANERVVEIPWALSHLPQSGLILDVGSCYATYLKSIQFPDRELHCLDPVDCRCDIPPGATFFAESIIGNSLQRAHYDAVMIISVLEHIGLPGYQQEPFPNGDRLAMAEIWSLLKPGAPAIVTVPAGRDKAASWYRQYSPAALRRLFKGWRAEFTYWGFEDGQYRPIAEQDVERYDYRDYPHIGAGAGAVAGIVARRS